VELNIATIADVIFTCKHDDVVGVVFETSFKDGGVSIRQMENGEIVFSFLDNMIFNLTEYGKLNGHDHLVYEIAIVYEAGDVETVEIGTIKCTRHSWRTQAA